MKDQHVKTPVWFWVLAVFFLLWNIMGVISFFAHTFISEEALAALPANERALYGEYPFWTTVVFAIAVFAGITGAVGLILKKNWATMAFVISLAAIIPQMIQNVFFTSALEIYGLAQALTMPILVLVFGVFLVWFSKYCSKKHWYNS